MDPQITFQKNRHLGIYRYRPECVKISVVVILGILYNIISSEIHALNIGYGPYNFWDVFI